MTSQLVLVNGLGIALASDSAVTLGGGRRTIDTAEKVIPLPLPHKIAILHSGCVELHGIPYQVLLNEWASDLGPHQLSSVDEYRRNFLAWLLSKSAWFFEERKVEECLNQLSSMFNQIRSGMLQAVQAGHLGSPESLAHAEVKSWSDGISTFDAFIDTDELWLDQTETMLRARIDESIEYWFDDVPRSEEIDACLRKYARGFLQHGQFDLRATLAFVGYGSEGVLPSYSVSNVAGLLAGRVLHLNKENFVGSSEMEPLFGVLPLGQTSAIMLFLRGFNPQNAELAADVAGEEVRSLRQELEAVLPPGEAERPEITALLEQAEERIRERISAALWEDSNKKYVDPLGAAVSGLPPATLAAVARSLVELQALRQTTTAEQNTVGGPIDVATISRHAGFEWVRHKSIA